MPVTINGTSGVVTATSYVGAGGNLTGITTGKILQVVQTVKTDATSTGSGTYSDISGLTVTITPSSSSSKILYSGHLYIASTSSEVVFRLTRTGGGSTNGDIAAPSNYADDEDGTFSHGGGSRYGGHSFQFLDTPNTTSAITYGLKWQTHSGTTYLNRTWDAGWFHGISTITAQEIAA